MPFHPSNSISIKYSSIENQKIHEYEYKKFLKTLENSIKLSKEKSFKNQQVNFNNNYLLQRQINLQYRQNKRKHDYECIQKENLKFTRKLINAKACLNRYEQEKFFNKHSKLKQRLQHYSHSDPNQSKKSKYQLRSKNHPIHNDNIISHQSNKLKEKYPEDLLTNINKLNITQKKFPRLIKQKSQISKTLPPIISIIQNTEKTSSVTPCSNIIINWNKSTTTDNIKPIVSCQSSESNLSDLFI